MQEVTGGGVSAASSANAPGDRQRQCEATSAPGHRSRPSPHRRARGRPAARWPGRGRRHRWPAARPVGAIKAVEHERQVRRGDSVTRISDLDPHCALRTRTEARCARRPACWRAFAVGSGRPVRGGRHPPSASEDRARCQRDCSAGTGAERRSGAPDRLARVNGR